jgi:hypothetical protein
MAVPAPVLVMEPDEAVQIAVVFAGSPLLTTNCAVSPGPIGFRAEVRDTVSELAAGACWETVNTGVPLIEMFAVLAVPLFASTE